MDFSKIEVGKLDMESAEFELEEVLDNLTNFISIKSEEKGLEFIFGMSRDVPCFLIGDPLRLEQVLTNLCNNAIKFTEKIFSQIIKVDKNVRESKMMSIEPGIKIAAQITPEPSKSDLQLIKQMGVEYVVLWTDGQHSSCEYYVSRRELFEEAGLKVYGFGNSDVHNQDAIVLNLPNRDEKIEEYKQHLWALGKAGIPYTTYAHMANGIWSTEPEMTRGGARARGFDLSKAKQGRWAEVAYRAPLTHGRKYTEEEIWDNFIYFIKQVTPVAEETGVRIGIHPDDPPVPELGGIPRCIFSRFDGYKRALKIADSPNVGMCLCVGCWLEGGEMMGKGVLETIRYFGEQNKLFKVHFRNVEAPLPHFVETFLNNGYMDMYKVMKALREVNFDGVVIADHIPQMGNGGWLGTAYTIGYMEALLERANMEVGE